MIEAIIWYLVLLDAIFANIAAIFFKGKLDKPIRKFLPLTKAWAAIYLLVVLWLGFALFRLGIL